MNNIYKLLSPSYQYQFFTSWGCTLYIIYIILCTITAFIVVRTDIFVDKSINHVQRIQAKEFDLFFRLVYLRLFFLHVFRVCHLRIP